MKWGKPKGELCQAGPNKWRWGTAMCVRHPAILARSVRNFRDGWRWLKRMGCQSR